MRGVYALFASMAVASCGASRSDSPPAATEPASPAPTSIIRPDVVTPEPTPTPMQPLVVTIRFEGETDTLSEAAMQKLETVVASQQFALGGPITIAAHTDSAGSDTANVSVSRKRGELVSEWLRTHDVAEQRMTVIAFGEQNPIRPNALPDGSPDEAGRRANRRVEIRVAVPNVGKMPLRKPTVAEELEDLSEAEEPR